MARNGSLVEIIKRGVLDYVVINPVITVQLTITIMSSFFLGLVTAMAAATVFFLFYGKNRLTPSTAAQLVSTISLYLSTCVFSAITFVYYPNIYAVYIVQTHCPLAAGLMTPTWGEGVQRAQSIIMTSALTVNMSIGDAVVWWRACAIWSGNRWVRALCAITLAGTLGFGSAATYFSGEPNKGFILNKGTELYALNSCGTVAFLLSFASNVIATSLIGYRAWVHRRMLRGSLGRRRSTRAMKVLALLIESGTGYCILWTYLVISDIFFLPQLNPDEGPFWFLYVDDILSRGFVTYLIALYPMLVIILVNLNLNNWQFEDVHLGTALSASVRFASAGTSGLGLSPSPGPRLSVGRFPSVDLSAEAEGAFEVICMDERVSKHAEEGAQG